MHTMYVQQLSSSKWSPEYDLYWTPPGRLRHVSVGAYTGIQQQQIWMSSWFQCFLQSNAEMGCTYVVKRSTAQDLNKYLVFLGVFPCLQLYTKLELIPVYCNTQTWCLCQRGSINLIHLQHLLFYFMFEFMLWQTTNTLKTIGINNPK